MCVRHVSDVRPTVGRTSDTHRTHVGHTSDVVGLLLDHSMFADHQLGRNTKTNQETKTPSFICCVFLGIVLGMVLGIVVGDVSICVKTKTRET